MGLMGREGICNDTVLHGSNVISCTCKIKKKSKTQSRNPKNPHQESPCTCSLHLLGSVKLNFRLIGGGFH
jgi:hypothetical protein